MDFHDFPNPKSSSPWHLRASGLQLPLLLHVPNAGAEALVRLRRRLIDVSPPGPRTARSRFIRDVCPMTLWLAEKDDEIYEDLPFDPFNICEFQLATFFRYQRVIWRNLKMF